MPYVVTPSLGLTDKFFKAKEVRGYSIRPNNKRPKATTDVELVQVKCMNRSQCLEKQQP